MTRRDRLQRRASFLSFVFGLAIGAGSPGCREAPSSPEASAPPRNLILISLDTLRPDFLGCYGSEFATSPTIDKIAAGGLLFEDASATSPWTLPSHASLLTGLYAQNHGASAVASPLSGTVHLAKLLQERGFETRAIVNSIFVAKFGLMNAFDVMHWVRERASQREPSAISEHAIAWLELRRATERPFFLFLHYYDAHSDYRAREEYEREFLTAYSGKLDGTTRQLLELRRDGIDIDAAGALNLMQRYAANIRQLDDQLKELFDYLERADLLRETLLILVSDHGEEFLEHGGVLHGETQYQELVRIPMILHGPGVPVGLRTAVSASLIDVVPTVLGLFGFDIPGGLDGVDLRRAWEDGSNSPERLIFFEADHVKGVEGSRRAVRDGRFKLHYDISSREYALFDLQDDPGEMRDVSADHPKVTHSLRTSLLDFLEAKSEPTTLNFLSEQEIQHLRALGYGE